MVFIVVALTLLATLRAFVYAGAHAMRRNGTASHPVIIVGAGVVGRRLAESLLIKPELGPGPRRHDRPRPRPRARVTCPCPCWAG